MPLPADLSGETGRHFEGKPFSQVTWHQGFKGFIINNSMLCWQLLAIQCSPLTRCRMCSLYAASVVKLAATFCTSCSFLTNLKGSPTQCALQQSRLSVINAWATVLRVYHNSENPGLYRFIAQQHENADILGFKVRFIFCSVLCIFGAAVLFLAWYQNSNQSEAHKRY